MPWARKATNPRPEILLWLRPSSLQAKASTSLKEIILKALEVVPGPLKALVYIPGLCAILALILCVVLIFKEKPEYAFWLAIAAFVLFALSMFCVVVVLAKYRGAQPQNGGGSPLQPPPSIRARPTWTRLVPRLQISEDTLDQIGNQLAEIRRLAHEKIQSLHGNNHPIKLNHVRANVFLPDTRTASLDAACELFIPKKMHVGMEPASPADQERAEGERSIRFKPNQGATGVTFSENTFETARVVETGAGSGKYEWPEKYSLTLAQKKVIHPNLKWVLSFPLNIQDGERQRAMGVLSVDGLEHRLEENDLKALIGELIFKVAEVAGLLAQQPMSRISLFVEDA